MASPALRAGASGNATILLYLSLFLLLLVFFIVLNAHSAPRDYRVKAVLGSVEHSFSSQAELEARNGAAAPPGSAGAVAVAGLKRLGDQFETDLAIVKVDAVGSGRLMVANMDTADLFEGGSAIVRNERMGLIDRIAREIGDKGGVRFDMDFLIAVGDEPSATVPIGDPVARAAAVARALVIDHAPTDAISVGIEPGRTGSARFLFSVHLPGDARPRAAGVGHGAP